MGSLGNEAFTVPTIDLSAYLQQPHSGDADRVVEQIRDACMNSGFFQLVGHGISEELQQRAFAASKRLFSLPDADKWKLEGKPGRGYERIGSQYLEEGTQPDLKESFFIGREVFDAKPPYRPFQEPNIWPEESQIPDSEFKSPLLEYHQALLQLSLTLMRILASGMRNLDTSVFTNFCQEPVASLRLLRYPPHPDTADETLVGAGSHTDFGAITLLLQDGHSGLQVLNQATNEWLDVAPRKDAYVVNVGDMLDVWTGGGYQSTVHRVINTSGVERYSIPFFFDGNLDCTIRALDGLAGDEHGRSFTVEEHMLSRYAASYKRDRRLSADEHMQLP